MSAEAHVAGSGSRRLGSILGSRSSSLERGMNALTKAVQATAAGDGTAVDDVYTAIASIRSSLGSLRRRVANVDTKDARRATVVAAIDGIDQALTQTVGALQAGMSQAGVDKIAAAASTAAGHAATIRSVHRRLP